MCHSQDDDRLNLHIPKDIKTLLLDFVLASYETRSTKTLQMERLAGKTETGPRLFVSFCRYKIRNKFLAERYVSPYIRPSSSFILHRKQRVPKFISRHDMTLYHWFEDASSLCFALCCKNIRTFRRVKHSKRKDQHYNYFYLWFYTTNITL